MLAANIAVAQMLRDKGIKFLRRAHDNPNPKKLQQLTKFAIHLGFDVDSLESRFELQRLLAMVPRTTGRICHQFCRLAKYAKGSLQPRRHRPFRASCGLLHPFYVTHPKISRSNHPSTD